MSRWAASHPDDYDSLIDAYRDEADTRRKESREGSEALRSDPRPLSMHPGTGCPLCGSMDHGPVVGALLLRKCGNCGARFRTRA